MEKLSWVGTICQASMVGFTLHKMVHVGKTSTTWHGLIPSGNDWYKMAKAGTTWHGLALPSTPKTILTEDGAGCHYLTGWHWKYELTPTVIDWYHLTGIGQHCKAWISTTWKNWHRMAHTGMDWHRQAEIFPHRNIRLWAGLGSLVRPLGEARLCKMEVP